MKSTKSSKSAKRAQKQISAEEQGTEASSGKRSATRIVAEVAVWGWVLSILGYFYYSRNFFNLLNQLWERASG